MVAPSEKFYLNRLTRVRHPMVTSEPHVEQEAFCETSGCDGKEVRASVKIDGMHLCAKCAIQVQGIKFF